MPANYDFTHSFYKQLIIKNLHTFLIFIYTPFEYRLIISVLIMSRFAVYSKTINFN